MRDSGLAGDSLEARLARYQAQYNLAYMLEHLPAVVRSTEAQRDKQQHKIEAYKRSQEGGIL